MSTAQRDEIQILHVDDDPSITDLTATFLEREDEQFSVQRATSADEGLAIVSDRPPDCVVSDYNMPGMDGIGFLQTVREEFPDLPFILYTGKGSEAVASDAIAADVTDYLQKESGTEQYELLANRIRNAVRARREAERADRQEQLMRLTEFNAVTGGFEMDVDSGNILLTDGTRRIIGQPDTSEIPLEDAIELFHPDDREAIHQALSSALETGQETQGTWRLQPGDGDERLLELTVTPVVKNGTVTALRGVGVDVTDRRERQRELRLLQQAIDDANVPITLADPSDEQPLVYVNDAFEEMTGYPPEETLGRNCRFLQDDDTDPAKVATLREAIDNEEPVTVELRNYRKDGTEFWNRLTVTPIYDDNGQLVRYLGIQENITGEREHERKLERSQELLRHSERMATLGGAEINPHTDEVRWTDGTRDIHEVGPDYEPTVETALDFFLPDDREEISRQFDHCTETGESFHGEYRLRTANDRVRWVELQGEAVRENGDTELIRGAMQDITDQKEHQRKLEAERRFTQQALDSLEDLFYVVNVDGSLRWWNEQVPDVTGYSESDLADMQVTDFFPEDDRERVADGIEAMVSGERVTVEADLVTADGQPIPYEFTGDRLTDEDGNTTGLVGIGRDVTPRRETQAEIDWHQAVIRNMGEGVYVLDAAYQLQFVKYRAAEIEAISEENWTGRHLSYLAEIGNISPREVEWIQEGVDRIVAGDTDQVSIEIEPQLPESSAVVEIRLTPLEVGTGDNLILASTRDVTEYKEREQEVLDLKRQYQTLAENLPNGAVFLFDENRRYIRARGSELQEVDISPDEIEGATPHDVFPEKTADELSRYFDDALNGDSHTFTQRLGDRQYRNRTVPVQSGDGDVTHGMALTQNVTDQAEQRQKLERQNERLEEFASIVSHDLRSPLTVAEGNIELARETCESDRLAGAADAIDRSKTLIEDLLTLAREGEAVADLEPVDLADVVDRCWQRVETDQATLEGDQAQVIEADRSRLQQLFENLYRNAVEHGGDNVTVHVGAMDDGFYVADTGPGIPDSDGQDVLKPGYSTSEDGTGLGLQIVEQVAKAHGWEVSVTDSEAGGARFEITAVEFVE